MGKKVVEKNSMMKKKKKKKKGRPSLLDLQKRNLKHHQQQLTIKNHKFQNPNPDCSSTPAGVGVRRSTRRHTNPNPDDGVLSSCKRTEKKLKLIAKLPDQHGEVHSGEDNSGSDSNPDDDRSSGSNTRKRKISSIAHGSGRNDDDHKGEKHGASTNQTSNQQDWFSVLCVLRGSLLCGCLGRILTESSQSRWTQKSFRTTMISFYTQWILVP